MPTSAPDPTISAPMIGKILFLVTEDWYFCSHRLPVARAARDAGLEVVVATRVNAHGDRIEAEGFRLIPIKMVRSGRNPWRELRTLTELIALYRRERPDIVHQVAMKPVLYGSIAARLARVPATVNALAGLGYVFASRGASPLRPAIRIVLRAVLGATRGRVVVQNSDDARALAELGLPPAQVTVIRGSGVDLERFRPTPPPAGEVVVSMVSRMLWDKGVGELVEAARTLKRAHPGVRVQLVGPPDPENPASIAEETLRGWHAEGIVAWLSGSEDVARIWSESHIAVLPSYREGLPKALLEAAACGRPIVATDVPGCREIVRHRESGLLVAPRDARALSEAIAELAVHESLRERMGRRGRELVEQDFSEARVAQETMALYRELIATGPSAPATRPRKAGEASPS